MDGPHSINKRIRRFPREHIEIPGGKIRIWKRYPDGSIKFNKHFVKLWSLLRSTGLFVNRGGVLMTEFTRPTVDTSTLIGTSFLTDPSSIVRVVLFDLKNEGGPIIISNRFLLETYSDGPDFEISWNIPERTDVRIGFYTSDTFEFNETNKLYLITGNKGPSIFNSNRYNNHKGSFRCGKISRIYVAVDKDVKVELNVKVIIPLERYFPVVAYQRPYTKYLNIPIKSRKSQCDNTSCNKVNNIQNNQTNSDHIECDPSHCDDVQYRIPVYTLTVPSPDSNMMYKRPTCQMKWVAEYIQEYLELTSLSITLFEPIEAQRTLYVSPQIQRTLSVSPDTYRLPITVYSYGIPVKSEVTMITNNAGTENRINEWGNDYVGLRLKPGRNMLVKIDYQFTAQIQVFVDTLDIIFRSTCQYYKAGLWKYHTNLNATTYTPEGDANIRIPVLPKISENEGPFIQRTINGSFLLQNDATDFNLTIYCEVENSIFNANNSYQVLEQGSYFNVTITYIPANP